MVRAFLVCHFTVLGLSAVCMGETPAPLNADETARLRTLDAKPLYEFSNAEIAEHLSLRNRVLAGDPNRPSVAEDVGAWAVKGLRQPYLLNAPRFDNSQTACVSFVERALALSLASDWNSYYLIRERLRHKGDSSNFFDRNFFTLAEWAPSSLWILEDMTDSLGGSETFTHVTRPQKFLRSLKFRPDETDKLAEQQVRAESAPATTSISVSYTPKARLTEVSSLLQTGDVALIIGRFGKTGQRPWLDCDHMGIVVRTADGTVTLVHSTKPTGKQEPIARFVERCPWVSGFKFLRVRQNARSIVSQELTRYATHVQAREPVAVDQEVQARRDEPAPVHE